MITITPTAPEIIVAQKPTGLQEAAAKPNNNAYEAGSKFDSLIKDNMVQEDIETELQDSLQGDDTPKTDSLLSVMSEAIAIAAEAEIPVTAGSSPAPLAETPDTTGTSTGVEAPQIKNNTLITQLPAAGSPGEMVNINAGTKKTTQSPEDTVVLSLSKAQENVISTSAERESLEIAFKEMVGRIGKETTNFTPNNVEEAAKETLLKNQADISVKPDQTGRVSEIENSNTGNSSTITSGSQKPADKPFIETIQRPSGFNEVLDKIVYVVKNNRSMDVSVLHEGNRLNINLTMNKGLLNVHINTNEAAMRELIENNIQDLVNNLEKDGVNISEFSVNLKDKRQNHNRENTFNHDMPVKGFTPPAHIMGANNGTGVVNIFV